MSHLLDVNILLAANWTIHPQNGKTLAWLAGKSVVLCPISQLGFLRISSDPRGPFRVSMEQARTLLDKFARERKVEFIPDNLRPLDSHPKKSAEVTDHYLADLAATHGLKLATLDRGLDHPAADFIS